MKTLGNPYAFVDRDMAADDAAGAPLAQRTTGIVSSSKVVPHQEDLFAQSPNDFLRESSGSGNPYSNVPSEDQKVRRPAATRGEAKPHAYAVTKQEFRAVSTSILGRYSPVFLKGRLRPRHRDFIVRNESKSPRARSEILAALKKFDLSQIRGLTTYLNREDDVFSEAELKAIEDSVDDIE